MRQDCVVILDVGKTLSKLSIWSAENELLERRSHRNSHALADGLPVLDVKGITFWLAQTLAAYAHIGEIKAIVPVAHGAAACIVDDRELIVPPLDYEACPPAEVVERYVAMRDPFPLTGSPRLPGCLNLGVQLLWHDVRDAARAARGRIVTWPQFWAWKLSGVASTEVTSLGCHTDLWIPAEGKPSPLAVANGWAGRLAPLRNAADVLGPVTPEWQSRCNLPPTCVVICGLHDSNAALLATRGYPEIDGKECTVLSTGTWFVAMHSMATESPMPLRALPEGRDCLVNTDVSGRMVPSARFMGGREIELLEAGSGDAVDPTSNPDLFLSLAGRMVKDGVMALPTLQKGVGPYPDNTGAWVNRPADQLGRRAVAGLYAALMSDTSLELIGSRQSLVIEGRYAADPVFTRALAALRPEQSTFLSDPAHSIPFGALRLLRPGATPPHPLSRVRPLAVDLERYADAWRITAETSH